MEDQKKRLNYPGKIARILLKVILFIFLFAVLLFILVLTPPVQRYMTGRVETFLQKKLNTKVEIGSISFGLSGKIDLENVYLEDQTKDTLLAGGSIKSHINFLKLFSNEVQVKDIELQNITAKVKRVLPDTVFNFQFIVDAFTTEKTKDPDTAVTAPLKLSISDLALENVKLSFTDVITGNDLFAQIGNLSVAIDTLDLYGSHYDIPSIIARNVKTRIHQSKPLIEPEPLSKDLADAATPVALKLTLGTIDLSKFNIQFSNDVSAFYTTLNVGQLKAESKFLDLQNNKIHLNEVLLNNTRSVVRIDKKETEILIEKEISQELTAQKNKGWDIRIEKFLVDNNTIQFDNNNQRRLNYGMDYAHILAEDLILHVEDLLINDDSIAATVTKGSMIEKSGFNLQQLTGELLYADNQAYLKDLYIKTPGTEIKRSLVLEYASPEALTKNFEQTVFNFEVLDSRVQVKDILVFAPQLRKNPALSNPNDVWNINLIGSGTLNRLFIESLQFDGLQNTRIDADGTLVGLINPAQAGGNFTIHKFHTTQTDLALFTGQRLSNAQINLPESFDITGTINGNAGKLNADLTINTSAGFLALNGNFSNLTKPAATGYNARIRTAGLQLGSILRMQDQVGTVSGNFLVSGRGLTPNAMNTKFNGVLTSLGYNNYQYHNIKLDGFLNGSNFSATADINDPNADLNLTASGNMGSNASYKIDGVIDSLKTLPLNFTTQEMIFRGKIDGTVANLSNDNLDADILITDALLVSNDKRLPLDTVQLISGRTDTANFIRLYSDIANAEITGQYRIADLATIIQSSIQPYFTVTPASNLSSVKPYNFRFTADVVYAPIFSVFMPTLTSMEPLHAEGTFTTNEGMRAFMNTPQINIAGNEMSDLNVNVNTSDSGLRLSGTVAHLKSGNTFDVYNTRINATALNNVIDFNVGIDDINAKNKYFLSGIVKQPSTGTYAITLKPDSLLLNYELWNVTPGNVITISPDYISATNFTLQKGSQQLSIASLPGQGAQPLQVTFTDFRLATITGFLKSDSLMADGLMNGNVTFDNILQQPVFTSSLTINDLSMKKDTIGNVSMRVDNAGNRYNANISLTGRGNDVLLTGNMTPQGKQTLMNLEIAVRQLQLNTLEGAMAAAFTNASGTVSGGIKVKGNLSNPEVNGELAFNKTSFTLTMLGSQFNIDNETLSVNEDGLAFQSFSIRDSANNALTLNGTVSTRNYINYRFNLYVNANNFLVLNSTKRPNSLYYGRLNISSDLYLSGTEIQPILDGALSVNDQTNLTLIIPQVQPGVVQREGVVEFVDMNAPENDSLFRRYDSLNYSQILGMDVAVNLEIKKEAIFNIIVDEANGDLLNVRGEALLSTGIDPSGKITMVGTYQLEEGAYELSFNFLKRRFDIIKGSKIIWTGSPTSAELDVDAVYIANTAPIDLVQDQIAAATPAIRNTYLQKLPFEVRLDLTGELMRPKVEFDVLLPENKNYGVSNDIVTQVQSRLAQIRMDPGEVNKQVFSLLLLNRFVGENPFQSGGAGFSAGTYARQSASKLLTEQLNNLAGGLIQGVDLNFDIATTEDYTTGERRNRTDLNIGLSKRLLNDRLQVSIGSNFELEGPQNSNQTNNNIAGNVAVSYQITKDGRYLLRFFRKNEYTGVVDGYIIETGLGFILNVDYNRFSEILRRRKQKVTPEGTQENGQEK